MLDNIATPEDLMKEASEIQAFLDITVSEDIEEIIFRGNQLAVYIARTGKMLADAKFHKDSYLVNETIDQLRDIINSFFPSKLPISTMNKLINASTKDANYLVDWIERLNKTATHQMDWCRSLVSKAKEDRKYSGGINNE